jgi:AcrR family transcriptional regulator
MFAKRSFASVSVRDITGEADVNLAAVNYYFGSKAALLKAVFLRRASQLNRERHDLLSQVLAATEGKSPSLDAVLRALLEPPVRWMFDPDRGLNVFVQFLARCQMEEEPELRVLFNEDVDHLRRFIPPLKQAVPDLSDEDICWCLHFALGAMLQTFTHLDRLKSISSNLCDVSDADLVVDRMIEFARGGFEAAQARRLR